MHILFTNGSVLPLKVFRSKYQDFRAANVKKFPTKNHHLVIIPPFHPLS